MSSRARRMSATSRAIAASMTAPFLKGFRLGLAESEPCGASGRSACASSEASLTSTAASGGAG